MAILKEDLAIILLILSSYRESPLELERKGPEPLPSSIYIHEMSSVMPNPLVRFSHNVSLKINSFVNKHLPTPTDNKKQP